MAEKLIITPKTKVLQLIEAYPELETVLINYVPAFEKLKNPILRKTVARVATLQQAASIGQVRVDELINHLRSFVGQDLFSGTSELEYKTLQPQWYSIGNVWKVLDAKKMLETGEHPVNQAIADLNQMPSGMIYTVQAAFLPAPLIDKASSLQFDHWVEKKSETSFLIHFFKA